MGMAAPVLGLVGTGLSIFGATSQAQGQAAGYAFQQGMAERRAMAARTAADQTDTQYREQLDQTLGRINAIRAAAGADWRSPTGNAILEEERRQSDRRRLIDVGNQRAQASMYDDNAEFYGWAADNAQSMGMLNAFTAGIRGLSGLASSAAGAGW